MCVYTCAQVYAQMWRPEQLLFNSSVIGSLLSWNLEPDWPMSSEASPLGFPRAMSEDPQLLAFYTGQYACTLSALTP